MNITQEINFLKTNPLISYPNNFIIRNK